MSRTDAGGVAKSESLATLTAPDGEFPMRVRTIDGVPTEVFGFGPESLLDVFDAMRHHGDTEALVFRDERVTFPELVRSSERLAAALQRSFGVCAGDRVAIAMRNLPEWTVAFWGAQLAGAVVVPVNAWSTAGELRKILEHAAPVVAIVDEERLDRLRPGFDSAWIKAHVISVGTPGSADTADFGKVLDDAAGQSHTPVERQGSDLATILYTSGTTAAPKGVMGTHLNYSTLLSANMLRARLQGLPAPTEQANRSSRLLSYPLFHISGLSTFLSGALFGNRVVLMYRWDPGEAVDLIDREHIREFAGAPVTVRELVEEVARRPDAAKSLRMVLFGGAPMPSHQIRAIEETFGGAVLPSTGYGLTETTGSVAAHGGAEYLEHPASVCRPVATIRLRIVDDSGVVVPDGAEGEVQVAGALVSPGYFKDPDATASARADGWFRTGDSGVLRDGRLTIKGRLKDVVIRGGENISCLEVEGVLDEHPSVVESAVLGRSDERMGEEVSAVVRVATGAELDAADLRNFAARRLAAFKVPTEVIMQSAPLPRTATGKIQKRLLSHLVGGLDAP